MNEIHSAEGHGSIRSSFIKEMINHIFDSLICLVSFQHGVIPQDFKFI